MTPAPESFDLHPAACSTPISHFVGARRASFRDSRLRGEAAAHGQQRHASGAWFGGMTPAAGIYPHPPGCSSSCHAPEARDDEVNPCTG